MSVQKPSKNVNYLRQPKKPFEMIYRQVLDKIKDADALAVYCHLSGKPDNWEINDQYLMNHFEWGRDKARNAINCLIVNKLIKRIQLIDQEGKFKGRITELMDGYDFKEYIVYDKKLHKNLCEHRNITPFTENQKPSPEKPSYGLSVDGKTAPTIEDIKAFKEEDKNKREGARKKRELLSENFKPDQEREAKAKAVSQRCNISYEDLLSKFNTLNKGKYNKCDTWQEDFDLFLLREKPSIKKQTSESKSNQEIRCTVPEYVPDAPIKRASIENVDKHMNAINKLLSRKVINGRVSTSKEERQR